MGNIEDVIRKMDTIVEQCKDQNSRAGYFAVLYRHVTIRVKEEIEKDSFDDNKRMEVFDSNFAQRFFDAFDSYSEERPVTKSWNVAFDASGSDEYLVMQQMLLGINAHINLDLGIAAAETMEGKNLDDLYYDYIKINGILASLVDGVKSNISQVSPLFGFLMKLTNGKDEMLVNFSIVVARDGAWKFANEYSKSTDRKQSILSRDAKISRLGRRIIDTGKWLSFLINIIRWGEKRTVRQNIEILEQVVVEVAEGN